MGQDGNHGAYYGKYFYGSWIMGQNWILGVYGKSKAHNRESDRNILLSSSCESSSKSYVLL